MLQNKNYIGPTARIIQHEYDPTQIILYTDRLNPLTKKMLESKLKMIADGKVTSEYPMKFL